ncbi:MAG: hypothetical protein QOE92_351 [Chloroflexota bacterium]|nr:hypothetical protein [Chloroflexota bacterium]
MLLGALESSAATYPLPQDNDLGGVWEAHEWASRPHSNSEYEALFNRDFRPNRISDAFFHVGPLDEDGTLPPNGYGAAAQLLTYLHHQAPKVRAQAWIGHQNRTPAKPMDLSDASTRERITMAADALLDAGFDGIHLDLEPVSSGDVGYLALLAELQARTAACGCVLSVAAPAPEELPGLATIGPFLAPSYDHWLLSYYREVAERVDQVVVMMYDTAAPSDTFYRLVVQWDVWRLERALGPGHELLIGVPTYPDRTLLHTPEHETLSGTIIAANRATAKVPPRERPRIGFAVYAGWTTTEHDWRLFRVRRYLCAQTQPEPGC